jgi:hypothetical protein
MDLGFETCGNASLIAYDRGNPVVVTDPWITEVQYFGSCIRYTQTSRHTSPNMAITAEHLPTPMPSCSKAPWATLCSIRSATWLRTGSWWKFFCGILLESDGGVFSKKALRRLLNGQAKGRANAERLFALVMLELWRREYRVSA